MTRYLKLYLYFLRFSFSKAMEFRIDFSFRIIMDILSYTVQFMFFNIVYLHTPILGGWSQDQLIIFIGAFIFVDAVSMTFFASNGWWFPTYINRGDLDYYLTKPVSSFFFMGFREIAANSFLNFILAICVLSYILITSSLSFDPIKIPLFFLCLINGAFLGYMVQLIFLMPVFWTQSPRGFGDLFYAAEKISHRPDGIFKGHIRRFFLYLLPFGLMASYPTRFLITPNSYHIIGEIILTSLGIYTVVYLMWKRGLRDYSSASS